MPSLGADMEVGTVVEWRVGPGDQVHRGDIVAVVDTEKSTIEVEVFEDGVVEEVLVPEGEEVAVGTPLARIGTGDAGPEAHPHPRRAGRTTSPLVRHLAEEAHLDLAAVPGTGAGGAVTRADVEQAAARAAPGPVAPEPVAPRSVPAEPVPAAARPPHRASPRARRLAAERGVDLAEVVGTGPDGAVVAADVGAGARVPGPAPGPRPSARVGRSTTPDDRRRMLRASLGALMARSKREIPHYYLSTTVDLGPATAWMARQNEARSAQERLVAAALLAKATALAASEVPVMNGHLVDGRFTPAEGVDLGLAISLRGGGLVAPALRGADRLDLDDLMGRLRDLVTRARAGTLRSSEMVDPTVTVTNLGEQGVEAVFGVVYPPQVALVGFGRVVERPWAAEGMLTVRPVVTATLSADHRVSDGHDGAHFLDLIDQHLQHPERL
jgi:pyruvate dehydrogenase E2 component (dihydrolipoamide acetyltransferase)